MSAEIQPQSIKLRPCENGFILSYETCKYEGGPYDGRTRYNTLEETFKPSEAAQATKRLTDLYKEAGKEMREMED